MDGINETSVHADSMKGSDSGDDDSNQDDDDEQGFDGTTTEAETVERRDEVGEVRKMSSKDTNRLRWWRIVVTGVLLLTAFAVTFTTYTLLKQQEDENFKTAVRFMSLHKQFPSVIIVVSFIHPFKFFCFSSIVVRSICSYRG